MQFPPGQYPPPPGQFPMPPSHFPGMPPPHATQPQPIPLPYPPPIPPPGLHEGPSAADRNLSISFRQSPPIGSSQSPPGNMQGLPERQLSVGIRAPPPGPNRAGGKFKPIAGFAAVESVTPPADRGQLGRFFPADEDSQAQQPSPAMHPQAQAAVQKLEEDQSNAWARWEAPTQQNPTQQGQQSAAGPTGSIQTATAEQTEQQSQPYIPLPTAHAPVFPGLIPPTPTVAQVNGANTLPPSPGKDQSKSFPSGLPPKPNFAGNLLPAFLPQKPGSLSSSSDTAVQHQLPFPPIPLASPSSAGTPQGEALPDALAKFRPRMIHKASSRSDKAEDSAIEDVAATKQPIFTPQTPSQALDQAASAKEASQSAQPSPAPSEVAQSKQSPSKGEGATDTTVGHEVGQQDMPAHSAPRIVSSELYERLAQVGEGTYGKVYKARRQDTGKLVALKRIRMEAEKDGFPVTAIREIKLLQSLDHPNVLKLMEMMVSKGHVYMVSEYLEHDLTGILNNPNMQSNKFTDANLKSLMQQLLAGLDYIHWRGVLHRDLKGSNILLGRNGDLKIADFGLAKFYDKRARNDYTNRVITLWYKPPELLFGETVYGPEVDMWSAG